MQGPHMAFQDLVCGNKELHVTHNGKERAAKFNTVELGRGRLTLAERKIAQVLKMLGLRM